MKADVRIRMGRRRPTPLRVPGELFDVYQPLMGVQATLLWLNLRWLEHSQMSGSIEEELVRFHVLCAAHQVLGRADAFGLRDRPGEYILHDRYGGSVRCAVRRSDGQGSEQRWRRLI